MPTGGFVVIVGRQRLELAASFLATFKGDRRRDLSAASATRLNSDGPTLPAARDMPSEPTRTAKRTNHGESFCKIFKLAKS